MHQLRRDVGPAGDVVRRRSRSSARCRLAPAWAVREGDRAADVQRRPRPPRREVVPAGREPCRCTGTCTTRSVGAEDGIGRRRGPAPELAVVNTTSWNQAASGGSSLKSRMFETSGPAVCVSRSVTSVGARRVDIDACRVDAGHPDLGGHAGCTGLPREHAARGRQSGHPEPVGGAVARTRGPRGSSRPQGLVWRVELPERRQFGAGAGLPLPHTGSSGAGPVGCPAPAARWG